MATVETVKGPIEASELGTTLVHEHLLARDEAVVAQWPHVTTLAADPQPTAVEQSEIFDVAASCATGAMERGVKTICDPSCMFLGRDVEFMRRVSDQTGLQVVPCTGIYTYDHLPPFFISRSPEQIAELLVGDLTEGIQGTEIKAAFLKCAADEPGINENVEKVHRAVAKASIATGAPIMAHSRPASETGPGQIEIFEDEGVDLSRVQIAHTGDSADLDYIERLLDKGVWIGLDRFGLELFLPFEQRIETALALLERGYAERMFLSADYCATLDWYPVEVAQALYDAEMEKDWSMNIVHDKAIPALLEGGMTDAQLETMLVDNPRRWLTGS